MNKIYRSALYAKYLASNWIAIAGMGLRNGPIKTVRDIQRYPWMKVLLRANLLMDKFGQNRDDHYYEATLLVVSYVIKGFVKILDDMFQRGDRLIIHEDMIPPEIFRAMGLTPFMAELLGIALPMIEPHAAEAYIDRSENQGVPPDVCSLPKSTMGFVLAGELPPALALVTSNLPCDGGMSSYTLIERTLNLPTIRLDIPHHFYSERAQTYFVGEIRRLIAWLEERTPGKMDWDKLRRICEERNRLVEYELDLWDLISARPAPLAAEPVYLSHLWGANVMPGHPETTILFKRLGELARKNRQAGVSAVKNEKYRALLWNPPLLHAIELFNWAERAYGVSLIMDSMTYSRREPYIDTSSEETMLYGLGQNIMEGPMARHTRGPAQNYLDDIFNMIKQFNIDMLWVAGHVGCKNTAALNGILREMCREHGLPLLIINYDLSDPRIVSSEGILEQVNHFMENIMKAKRLDV